jgi:hypothetical protein
MKKTIIKNAKIISENEILKNQCIIIEGTKIKGIANRIPFILLLIEKSFFLIKKHPVSDKQYI